LRGCARDPAREGGVRLTTAPRLVRIEANEEKNKRRRLNN